VRGDAERGDAAFARDGVGEAQDARIAVVVVGQRAGRRADGDVGEAVGVEQRPRGLCAGHARVVGDRAVAGELARHEPLAAPAEDDRDEEEQPDDRGHVGQAWRAAGRRAGEPARESATDVIRAGEMSRALLLCCLLLAPAAHARVVRRDATYAG
jgi:hypothetical protein